MWPLEFAQLRALETTAAQDIRNKAEVEVAMAEHQLYQKLQNSESNFVQKYEH